MITFKQPDVFFHSKELIVIVTDVGRSLAMQGLVLGRKKNQGPGCVVSGNCEAVTMGKDGGWSFF